MQAALRCACGGAERHIQQRNRKALLIAGGRWPSRRSLALPGVPALCGGGARPAGVAHGCSIWYRSSPCSISTAAAPSSERAWPMWRAPPQTHRTLTRPHASQHALAHPHPPTREPACTCSAHKRTMRTNAQTPTREPACTCPAHKRPVQQAPPPHLQLTVRLILIVHISIALLLLDRSLQY